MLSFSSYAKVDTPQSQFLTILCTYFNKSLNLIVKNMAAQSWAKVRVFLFELIQIWYNVYCKNYSLLLYLLSEACNQQP